LSPFVSQDLQSTIVQRFDPADQFNQTNRIAGTAAHTESPGGEAFYVLVGQKECLEKFFEKQNVSQLFPITIDE
jgi:hypothetical protein